MKKVHAHVVYYKTLMHQGSEDAKTNRLALLMEFQALCSFGSDDDLHKVCVCVCVCVWVWVGACVCVCVCVWVGV
jgi:hypothetical protein